MEEKRAIGLMSGTSVDSIDAAVVTLSELGDREELRETRGLTYPIPAEVRRLIFTLFEDGPGSLKNLIRVNFLLGELFSEAVHALLKQENLQPHEIEVIGSHGQTIYHMAEPEILLGMNIRGTLQVGEGSVIADRTGIPVISDFRTADVAAGGSGAPLVPFLDRIIADQAGVPTAFQNIGGIGNVTLAGGGAPLVAFDTGPGNLIVDNLVERYTGGELSYDRDGFLGKQGKVLPDLLERWMAHPYLKTIPPKSTGREEFGSLFYRNEVEGLPLTKDLIRTAEEYTVRTIIDAYGRYLPVKPERVIVSGGGAHNPLIMEGLKRGLEGIEVLNADEAGISTDYKEACAFALMGYRAFRGRTNNIPEATGASRPVIMGKLSLPPMRLQEM